MSPDIIRETEFLLCSVFLGAAITFVYDWIRIFRRLIKHGNFFVSFEDFLFWIFCSIAAFAMLYKENNGVIRWFAVIGATGGMFFYKLLISRYFVEVMVMLLAAFGKIIKTIWKIIITPFQKFGKKVGKINRTAEKNGHRLLRFLKKKLTDGIKVVRIMLCKH